MEFRFPKKLPAELNETPFSTRRQKLAFDDITVRQDDVVRSEILELYAGTKAPGAAITEIILEGAH